MRRIILSVLLMLLVIPVVASAHSGRTDGDGGHTDRSTGDYHYHHGYPAHDHYDMDGDGDIDCPYDFKDKTNHSSNSNSGMESGNSSTNYKDKGNDVSTTKESNPITFFDVLKAMLSSILPTACIFVSSSYFLSFIFFFIFGESKGCAVSLISGGVVSLIAYVWLIIVRLT